MRIAASEYEFLKRNFGEYLNLRKNLLEDGVTPDTLEMYIQPRLGSTYGPSHNFTQYGNSGASSSYVTTDQSSKYSDVSASARVGEFSQQPIVGSTFHGFMTSASAADCTPAVAKDLAASHNPEAYPFRMHGHHLWRLPIRLVRTNAASISIGVSPDTTLNEILEHVKGGMVLDIFRWNDRTACLSFFRGTDAQAYWAYARRHDVYIKNKRVEVDWADRQFYPNTATYKRIINNGATRILRLCNAANQLNEQTVRDDMEHIHNLVILRLRWRVMT
ncbi:putative RNA recognition motif containing protein [Botryosphaeria dothidea]|uniref:RNA recognition motif containing protein n=1 Tax=Botryosphaeria dothidea TaxID=55169 RepID=A0A8H4IM59_9PEZI|nr:putative RNA recognition motif containing protein [Botryosphaeria dothidea]